MPDTYLVLKAIHVLGVVLFLGNIIVTAWWKAMADRTGEPVVIAFAQQQVVTTDWIFTAGGIAILLAAGMATAALHGLEVESTLWLRWAYWLFVLSGVIWALVLIPCQAAQNKLAKGFARGGPIPERYWQLNRIWFVAGIAATVIPMGSLWLMVTKPV